MTALPLYLTGKIRQHEADALRQQILTQLDDGGLTIHADGLEEIEVGPLQVLLCGAAEAARRRLPCHLDINAVPAVDRCLSAVRLPAAANLFTLIPTTEVSVKP